MSAYDRVRYRECSPDAAPPGWCLRAVARCQGHPGQTFDRPRHAYTSIEYVEEGVGDLTVAGRDYHLERGDAFILPRDVAHLIRCDDQRPWRVLFMDCEGELPAQLATAYGLQGTHVFRATPISQPIRNLLNFVGDEADLHLRAAMVLHEVMAMLYTSSLPAPDWPEPVIQAKAFIDANLESGIKLADVADHVGCSLAHLSRTFRRCVGQPPGDYLVGRRMDLAKALLDTSDEPIKSIAQRLGYSDAYAFSHAFKSRVGQAPSAWREAQQEL